MLSKDNHLLIIGVQLCVGVNKYTNEVKLLLATLLEAKKTQEFASKPRVLTLLAKNLTLAVAPLFFAVMEFYPFGLHYHTAPQNSLMCACVML